MHRRSFRRWAALGAIVGACLAAEGRAWAQQFPAQEKRKVVKTDAEWRKLLTPVQYRVTREKWTEPAGTGIYAHNRAAGTYLCVCCETPLFSSRTKFESGTGWPSFYAPLRDRAIDREPDYSDGSLRIEVNCHDCGGHLGHVFDDGPPPTGLRFCMNSASLKFVPDKAPAPKAKATKGKAKKGEAGESSDPEPGKKDL